MIVYNPVWIANNDICKDAHSWMTAGIISKPQYEAILAQYPCDFYQPSFFIKVTLFIFTLIGIAGVLGLLFLPFMENNSNIVRGLFCLVFAVAIYFGLTYTIKDRKLFKSGIDNAVLYCSIALAITGFTLLINDYNQPPEILIYLLSLPILIFSVIRFADLFCTLLTIACVFYIVFNLSIEGDTWGKSLLPFITMFFSATLYILAKRNKNKESLLPWYECLLLAEVTSLLLFYAGGNYFVVRTMSEELLGLSLSPNDDIPMAYFFYAFSAMIPLIYTYLGVVKRDKVLVRVGMLLIAMGVLTFKYYFSLGHHEVSLTVAGLLMILTAFFVMRILKPNPKGYTSNELLKGKYDLEGEHLVIAQTMGVDHHSHSLEFGGGEFGGAGSEGKY